MCIDVYVYYFLLVYIDKLVELGFGYVCYLGQLNDLILWLKMFDDNKCDYQILFVVGFDMQVYDLVGVVVGVWFVNDIYVDIVKQFGGCFCVFGWVLLFYVDEVIVEVICCFDELKFEGICFVCFYYDCFFDDLVFELFWVEFNWCKVKVYIYLVGVYSCGYLGMKEYNFSMVVGLMVQLQIIV